MCMLLELGMGGWAHIHDELIHGENYDSLR